jgi:hypothetical protein
MRFHVHLILLDRVSSDQYSISRIRLAKKNIDNLTKAGSNSRDVNNSRSKSLYFLARLGSRIRPITFLKLLEYYVQEYDIM